MAAKYQLTVLGARAERINWALENSKLISLDLRQRLTAVIDKALDEAGVPVVIQAAPAARSCNMHNDCDAADRSNEGSGPLEHCRIENCVDCFGH